VFETGNNLEERQGLTERVPTILIVDDIPVNLALAQRILRSDGYRTLVAADGFEALKVCATVPVDLILLDVMMPEMDGFQVCAGLKSNPATRDIPVIFLSALDDVESRVTGLNGGGVDYIAKPFDAQEVRARVRVHLRTRREVQSLAREQRAQFEELREAQRSMLVLPEDLPEACFAVYYRPLQAVGGDFYDVVPLGDDLIGYFVADISGHGVAASFLTSAVKALLRQCAGPLCPAQQTMQEINSVMRETLHDDHYLTACYVRLHRRELRLSVVSAGHPPLIRVSRDGQGETVAVEGDPLGVFGSGVFERREINVQAGDRFYLYTDGLIENHGSGGCGRAPGLGCLLAACGRRHALPLDQAVRAIVEDVKPEGRTRDDDLLLLGVEVRPS
jgi:sigma-B regulation protein RsbU (phosphoserine phosphatase)